MNEHTETSRATIDAERALLGAILIKSTGGTKEIILACLHHISASDFIGYYPKAKPQQQPQHARIYLAMSLCEDPPHQINVARKMNELGILQPGDCSYFYELISVCPCSLDYMDYAQAVLKYSRERNPLKKLANKRMGLGY